MQLTRIRELDSEPALTIGDDRTMTYGELRGAAGAVAAQLADVSRVAVWAENTLEAIVAMIAAVESGVELVPLNPKLGSSELDHILGDARPEVVLGAPDAATGAADARAGGADAEIGASGSAIRNLQVDLGSRAELPSAPTDGERVAMVVYTSGTTGRPKGVLIPRRAIATNLDALAEAWGWTQADRLTHALPVFHVHGLVLGTFGPLRLGGHVRHLGRFDPWAMAAALRQGATMAFGVPTMYHRIAEAAEADQEVAAAFAAARLLVSGSAGLPSKTFERIAHATGQQIVERYGLTETLMNTAVRHNGTRRAGEVGLALPGVELRIVTDDGADAPSDGETLGEVVIRGENLFTGYLNRPDATAEVLRDGWFWTGDLATRAADGYVRIVGRKAIDLIKTGGYKVGAGEVEGALLEHPAISEVAVAGRPHDDLGEQIAAWIVLEQGAAAPTQQELANHVAELLSPHKRPRQVHFVIELPRNAMGKVVKQKLTAP